VVNALKELLCLTITIHLFYLEDKNLCNRK